MIEKVLILAAAILAGFAFSETIRRGVESTLHPIQWQLDRAAGQCTGEHCYGSDFLK